MLKYPHINGLPSAAPLVYQVAKVTSWALYKLMTWHRDSGIRSHAPASHRISYHHHQAPHLPPHGLPWFPSASYNCPTGSEEVVSGPHKETIRGWVGMWERTWRVNKNVRCAVGNRAMEDRLLWCECGWSHEDKEQPLLVARTGELSRD